VSDETPAKGNLKKSTVDLEVTLETLKIENDITALQGIIVSGGKLTAEQSRELADLKTRLSKLKGEK
jgi:hypothetical protein